MARLNADPAGSSVRGSSVHTDSGRVASRSRRSEQSTALSTSPGPTSDKENQNSRKESGKRHSGSMAPPAPSAMDARTVKRRRLGEMDAATSNASETERWYDPTQPETERSEVTKGYRNIHRQFNGMRIIPNFQSAGSLTTTCRQPRPTPEAR